MTTDAKKLADEIERHRGDTVVFRTEEDRNLVIAALRAYAERGETSPTAAAEEAVLDLAAHYSGGASPAMERWYRKWSPLIALLRRERGKPEGAAKRLPWLDCLSESQHCRKNNPEVRGCCGSASDVSPSGERK